MATSRAPKRELPFIAEHIQNPFDTLPGTNVLLRPEPSKSSVNLLT